MNSSNLLTRLTKQCYRPIFSHRSEVQTCVTSLLDLASCSSSGQQGASLFLSVVKRFVEKDPSLICDVLSSSLATDVHVPSGRWLSLAVGYMPRRLSSNTRTSGLYAKVLPQIVSVTGCVLQQKGAITAQDATSLVLRIAHWDRYDTAFVEAVAGFVEDGVTSANEKTIAYYMSLATSLSELRGSSCTAHATDSAAHLMKRMDVGTVGHICHRLNRVEALHNTLALSVQEEASRIAEGGDLFTVAHVFSFVCRHDESCISVEALQWWIERLVGSDLDRETVILLCRALDRLPARCRHNLLQDWLELFIHLCTQVRELLQVPSADGGLLGEEDVVAIEMCLNQWLRLQYRLPPASRQAPPAEFMSALSSCASFVGTIQEQLVTSSSPPFSLMAHMLNCPSADAKKCALILLSEMAEQHFYIPSVQTFTFLLALGDNKITDHENVARYLRMQMSKTLEHMPPVQLCAALRSLCVCTAPAEPSDSGEWQSFFRVCTELIQPWFSHGVPLRCVLSAVASLYALGYRDKAFYTEACHYVDLTKKLANPSALCRETAKSVLSIFEEAACMPPSGGPKEFLESAAAKGITTEVGLRPTAWMELHDPSNALLPPTAEQQECVDIIEKMVQTRSDQREELVRLAKEYLQHLAAARPDDHKYFFGVFAEKVLKEDKLLKECLESLERTGIVTKLSATTIASILDSLAVIRFIYTRSVKRFVLAISVEQWAQMDGAPLIQILSGLEKLSLRIPSLLDVIAARLMELCNVLYPRQIAESVRALQTLHCGRRDVVEALLARAAVCAGRFDEHSLTILMSTPALHRFLGSERLALPLLRQANAKIQSPSRRLRIATIMKRSDLPREALLPVIQQLTSNSATEASLLLQK